MNLHSNKKSYRFLGAWIAGSSVGLATVSGCVVDPTVSEEIVYEEIEDASLAICGTDGRNPLTSIAFPRGAVGKLTMGGGRCSATIIGRNKVLTAQHCVGPFQPNQVSFRPQDGILVSGSMPPGVTASNATRMTLGRDDGDTEERADWAILTFATDFEAQLGSNYQKMDRVIPTTVPTTVTSIGYGGSAYASRPSTQNCSLTDITASGNVLSSCDVEGGHSGGPLYRVAGSSAQIFGVLASGGGCVDGDDSRFGNGEYYSFAPDNAGGVGTAYTGNGRVTVFSSDRDWNLVTQRSQKTISDTSSWHPWYANDSAFSGGRKLSAVNLEDGRQQLFVVTSGGELRTRWQNAIDGAFSSWTTHATPVNVKDVVVTGGSGIKTHVFVLGTDNSVRVTNKVGNAGSAWSSWVNLGTVSGATALSGVHFSGVHQIFVAHGTGATTSWGSNGSFAALQGFGGVSGGLSTIAGGALKDGRIHVLATDTNGALRSKVRALDGSSWSSWSLWSQAVPFHTTGFRALTSAKLPSGYEQVFGVGNDGNVYTIRETNGGLFSTKWIRFYK